MTDYQLLKEQAEAIIETEPHYVAALSNISALIYESLDRLNWAGFYLMDRGSLLVGPLDWKGRVRHSGEGREDSAGRGCSRISGSHRLRLGL